MDIKALLRGKVKLADKITKSLQVNTSGVGAVLRSAYVSSDSSGTKTFATAVPIEVIVEYKNNKVTGFDGSLVVSRANFISLNPSLVFNEYDIITLPDGSTASIVAIGGALDAGTGKPFAQEVFLG